MHLNFPHSYAMQCFIYLFIFLRKMNIPKARICDRKFCCCRNNFCNDVFCNVLYLSIL